MSLFLEAKNCVRILFKLLYTVSWFASISKSHQSNYWLCQKKNTLSFHRSEEQSWTKSQSLKKKNSTNTTIVGYHSLFFVSSSFQCDPKMSILKSGSTVRLVLIASVCTTLLLSNVSRPKLLQSMLFRLLSLKSTHCRKKKSGKRVTEDF